MNLRICHLFCLAAISSSQILLADHGEFVSVGNVEEVSAVHKLLQGALAQAAKGEPVSRPKIESKVEQAVNAQIEQFAKQCKRTGDAKLISSAAIVKADEDLREHLKLLLLSELTHQDVAEMELRGIRDTLDYLEIQIAPDYSIIPGALPESKGVVRIRLPDFHACPSCKRILEKALNDSPGIEQALVDTKTNTAQFVVDLDLDIVDRLDEIKNKTVQLAGWQLIRKGS